MKIFAQDSCNLPSKNSPMSEFARSCKEFVSTKSLQRGIRFSKKNEGVACGEILPPTRMTIILSKNKMSSVLNFVNCDYKDNEKSVETIKKKKNILYKIIEILHKSYRFDGALRME